jgi:CMP/dCMP kinase
MQLPLRVAIDGAAGSGKSTLGELLAARIDYTFLDTGKLYRAISKQAISRVTTASDEEAVVSLTRKMKIEVQPSRYNGNSRVMVEGESLDDQDLYSSEINRIVPVIAAYPGVRKEVRTIQRKLAEAGKVVIAGRDIGTVVMPEADFKIFLEVSIDERVRRRYLSLKLTADATEEEIKADLLRRDDLDRHRSESPLRIPEDAFTVKTDGMGVPEVVDLILELMKQTAFRMSNTA